MISQPNSFAQPPTIQEVEKEKDEFFNKLLKSLDGQLKGKKNFCGNEVTVADLQYYNEISTIVHLSKHELTEADFPNLAPWFGRMSTIPEIMPLDKKLDEVISKYNIK